MSTDVIDDADELYRRIHPDQVKDDGTISSAAFNTLEMSVDRATLYSPTQSLEDYSNCGLASFTAGFARELQQEVIPAPVLFNPAHALVKGKKTKGMCRRFAKMARILKQPDSDRARSSTAQSPR
jgi:hypothetical protein